MAIFKFASTFGLVLLLLAVVVLGAPQNNSTSSGQTKSVSTHQTRGGQGNITRSSSSTTKPLRIAQSSASPVRPVRLVNSTRVTRDTQQVSGGLAPIAHSGGNNSSKVTAIHTSRGSSFSNVNSTKSTTAHSASSPTSIGFGADNSKTNNNARKSNSTRLARAVDESEVDASEESLKSKSSNSSQRFVPSTHPLFANRQSSNITDSLKPKLRGHSSLKSSNDSATTSVEDTDKSTFSENVHIHPIGHKQSSSSEESISVISSGPVSVQSRNSSHPSRPALRNPSSGRRVPSSSTAASIENEEVEIFII